MKVVQLVPELNEGGVERGVVDFNREIVARGIDSTVISAGGKLVPQIIADGGSHIQFDLASKNILTVPNRVSKLRFLLQKIAPDILHARSRVPAWITVLANRTLRYPFVTTVHGFNSVNAYSKVMVRGDRVICVSKAIQDYVLQHYGVDQSKLRIIPRGIDLDKFSPDRNNQEFRQCFSKEFGLAERVVVSTVGRVTQLKDLETFIRAIGIVSDQRSDILGLVVGGVREDKREYFASLQRLVAELSLGQYVLFTGSQSEVADIYAMSHLVVSSSSKPESFGRSAAEALSVGTPVVATGHGGILDIVIDGETGYVFRPGDATELADRILTALDRPWPGLRKFVQQNFGLEQMVDKTLQVYEELLKKS